MVYVLYVQMRADDRFRLVALYRDELAARRDLQRIPPQFGLSAVVRPFEPSADIPMTLDGATPCAA